MNKSFNNFDKLLCHIQLILYLTDLFQNIWIRLRYMPRRFLWDYFLTFVNVEWQNV